MVGPPARHGRVAESSCCLASGVFLCERAADRCARVGCVDVLGHQRQGAGPATLLAVALVASLAACSADPRPHLEGQSLDAPAAPAEPSASADSSEPTDATGPMAEVSLTRGHRPFSHRYTGYFGTFDRSAEQDMPASIGDPPVPDGLGPLVITSRIERFPISCIRWHRTIVGVDVGDEPGAARISAHIAGLAADLHAAHLARFGTEHDCDGLSGATAIGETYQELRALPCEIPLDVRLRCFELGDFGGYPGIANGFVLRHQLVFDASTGDRLSLGDLFASVGGSEQEGIALVKGLVAELNDWDATVRQAIPTHEGMTFGFSPYEAGPGVDGSLDLFVPWSVIMTARSTG